MSERHCDNCGQETCWGNHKPNGRHCRDHTFKSDMKDNWTTPKQKKAKNIVPLLAPIKIHGRKLIDMSMAELSVWLECKNRFYSDYKDENCLAMIQCILMEMESR